jgi:hypothetical protein
LCSLSFIDLCLLITPLVSSNFWSLRCLSFINFCLTNQWRTENTIAKSLKIPKG